MIAYTGIETVSNLSEEARDPCGASRARSLRSRSRSSPSTSRCRGSRSPRCRSHTSTATPDGAGRPPPHGFANDPVLGLVNNLGIGGTLFSGSRSTSGCSPRRSSSSPERRRDRRVADRLRDVRLPPVATRFPPAAPEVQDALDCAPRLRRLVRSCSGLPGRRRSWARSTPWRTFSFTIAHASVIQLLRLRAGEDIPWTARPNFRWRGVDWPLFAVFGALGTGLSWLDIVIQYPSMRYAGLAWLAARLGVYVVYRRRILHDPLARDDPRAGRVRPRGGAGVPQHSRPDRAGLRLRRGHGLRLPARGRAARLDRRGDRDRGSARPAARRVAAGRRREANEQLDEARAIGDSTA